MQRYSQLNVEEYIPDYDCELWKECKKSTSPQDAYALVNLMSDISEQCLCARWHTGTEQTLWNIMNSCATSLGEDFPSTLTSKTQKDRFWGMSEIPLKDVNQLSELSRKCNGWWIWNDQTDREQFLTLVEAKEYFAT